MSTAVGRGAAPWVLFAGAAAALVGLEDWITATDAFGRRSDLVAAAITLDLALGLSLLEVGVLALLVVRARRVVARYRAVRPSHVDAADALEDALGFVLGSRRAGAVVVSEATLLRYGIAGWFSAAPPPTIDEFSYHRRGSYPVLLIVIGVVGLFETAGVHVLLSLWQPVVAWIVTGLGLYGMVWVAGDFHAGRLHPIRVADATLTLRTGLRWRVRVPLASVAAIHDEAPAPGEPRVAFVFIGAPDFWVELRQPVEVRGLLGMRRTTRWLGIAADDSTALRRRLE